MRSKYPRTLHHPKSLSVQNDDKIIAAEDLRALLGTEVVVTEKMDGECTTVYPDGYTHARSVDSKYHPSRTWMKGFAATVGHQLPAGHRICGENLYAKHSVGYEDLPSYFLAFSVWDGDIALEWDWCTEWLPLAGVEMVDVVYRGILTEEVIDKLWKEVDTDICEGLVFRSAGKIHIDEFHKKVFKMVRENHVQTDKHWMNQEVIPNALSKEQA